MAYSKFKLEQIEEKFGIEISISTYNFFDDMTIEPSEWLKHSLKFSQKVSLMSEKARSEMIVSPILLETLERNNHSFSMFSGAVLDADVKQGLNGECDYIFSKKPQAFFITAPIFGLVEAKKQDIDLGMPQCIAQLIGAKVFNERRKNEISVVYGCVTTGEEWQFLKLEEKQVLIDKQKYFIKDVNLILGVLQQIVDRNS